MATSHQLGGQGAARDFLHVESIYLQLDSGGSGGLVKWGGGGLGFDWIACLLGKEFCAVRVSVSAVRV